ncbi:MAG: hypothetical protein QXR58_01655 [Candidatus Micrarchaeaceae archaeon]
MQEKTKGEEYFTLNLKSGIAVLSLLRVADLEKTLNDNMKIGLAKLFKKKGEEEVEYVEAKFDTKEGISTMNKLDIRYKDGSTLELDKAGVKGAFKRDDVDSVIWLINILFDRNITTIPDSSLAEIVKVQDIKTGENRSTDFTEEAKFIIDPKTGEKRRPSESELRMLAEILRRVNDNDDKYLIISKDMKPVLDEIIKSIRRSGSSR